MLEYTQHPNYFTFALLQVMHLSILVLPVELTFEHLTTQAAHLRAVTRR